MNENEIRSFVAEGRLRLTNLNSAIRALNDWSASFAMRGGVEIFDKDAALIAEISLKVQEAITDTDRATVARLRTDV